MQYYRVKDDLGAFGHIREFGSGFTAEWYPAVFPLGTNPKSGEAYYKITSEWWSYIVTGQPAKLRWVGQGWINTSTNKGFGWKFGDYIPLELPADKPVNAECVICTGNAMAGDVIKSGSLMPIHYLLSDKPQGDYYHQPWLWSKATSLSKYTGAIGLWDGADIYYPLLNKLAEIYMPLEWLEPFPALPFKGKVMESGGLNVREDPTVNGQWLRKLKVNTPITIVSYHLWGSDVWGQLEGGGWVCLCYALPYRRGFEYYSSWHMETDPPLGTIGRVEQPVSDFSSVPTELPTPDGTYYGMSNQQVINAFYQAAEVLKVDGWALIDKAGMTWLVEERQAVYEGALIEKNERLMRYEQQLISEYLMSSAGMEWLGTYDLVTNQEVINAFYKVADKYGGFGWDWIAEAGLDEEVAGVHAVRQLTYRGPIIEDTPLWSPVMGPAIRDIVLSIGGESMGMKTSEEKGQ